jgi:guanylate kinase
MQSRPLSHPPQADPDSTPKQFEHGWLVVLSGPSGVGKTTIAKAILNRFGGAFSVSATTRARSAGEVDGQDYFFITEEQFQEKRQRDEFLECAHVFGKHWYGTPRQPVEEQLRNGRTVLLDIDVQGGLQVRRAMPQAFMIFIEPPGDDELLRRLRSRGRDDESAIERRFAEAKHEINLARDSSAYDAIIVNDNLDRAIDEACTLIDAARKRSTGDATRR